jgi:hypothetical protein
MIEKIGDGLREQNYEIVERGLIQAYENAVESALSCRRDDLVNLGHLLTEVTSPSICGKVENEINRGDLYFGQIKGLIILCDYFSEHIIPDELRKSVRRSKHSQSIIKTLSVTDGMLATELSNRAGLPHATQLKRTIRPLCKLGIIQTERFGKNIWYMLTPIGRLIANQESECKLTERIDLPQRRNRSTFYGGLVDKERSRETIIQKKIPKGENTSTSLYDTSIPNQIAGLNANQESKYGLREWTISLQRRNRFTLYGGLVDKERSRGTIIQKRIPKGENTSTSSYNTSSPNQKFNQVAKDCVVSLKSYRPNPIGYRLQRKESQYLY